MKPELYALQWEEDETPLPCRYCGVPTEHDGELHVFVYPLDQPSRIACAACHGRLPGPVRRLYEATLDVGVAVYERTHQIMDIPPDVSDEEREQITPAVPFEQAVDAAMSAPEVVSALSRHDTARAEASEFLFMPTS
ncbi:MULTISPECIES: hypothetical protein [unclassified Streptomyces]|uniref:hypothetical protein n=1 Tax=unclassified Streptomyces TaxID=2593676 RepID=UPI00224F2365|nr:hypothetical protein [Streptomyces sp. NBC_01264]MCX4783869.1 hypothetical protein [Streptomyces sp. NBC_01264]